MFKRKPKAQSVQPPPRNERGGGFGVSTKIARATGSVGRYACNSVRVMPASQRGKVLLQATDGHQAVCVLVKGKLAGSHLVPASVLPSRQLKSPIAVRLVDGQWESTDGKVACEHIQQSENEFPSIGKVLPQVSDGPADAKHANAQMRSGKDRTESAYLVLGIDLDVLRKTAGAFGTSKLTLLVPLPANKETHAPSDQAIVNKPIAVCPANDDSGEQGIGVVMPLAPVNTHDYYKKVRQLVLASEKETAKRSSRKRAAVATV